MSTTTNNEAPADLDSDLSAWIVKEISAEYFRDQKPPSSTPTSSGEKLSTLHPVSPLPPAAAPVQSGGHAPGSEDNHPFGEPRWEGVLSSKPAASATM